MVLSVLLTIMVLISVILILRYYHNLKWQSKPLKNFPFTYKGKEFWYSRAVAVAHFVFARNSQGELCVLANRRGLGTPDYQGFWNCPCGYLDFGEDGESAAQRETYEETNVYVPKNQIKMYGVNTSPDSNKQNVTIRYYSYLSTPCDTIDLSDKHSEPNEVMEIKWLPLKEVDSYNWAFGHDIIINNINNNVKF